MLIIPAIDIRNGKCVRLTQGDYAAETIYGDDPVVIAQKWVTAGAQALHVVDLDGARSGQPVNLPVIKNLLAKVKIPVQVGGGIQSAAVIQELLALGASQVVLGTLALENETQLKQLLSSYADQIIVSLDSKNGQLAKRGWLERTDKNLLETAQTLQRLGVKRFIYTNVLKDGTLSQPDYVGIQTLLKVLQVPLIVAGGVSTQIDLQRLKVLKVAGVIIGKALYEGTLTIQEANNAS